MNKVLPIFIILLSIPFFVLATAKIEINTASLSELEELTGVGPTIAQRIIDARPFSLVDDLLKVKGIGEKTLQKIKEQGLAYVMQANQTSVQNQTTTPTQPPPTPLITPTSTPTTTYQNGIVINEILPSPEGPDQTDEWIELYNNNSFNVSLADWKLEDTQGTTTTYILPKETIIGGLGYLVLRRPETKISLNNDTDGVNLLWPDGKIVDVVSYQETQQDQSYNRVISGWRWSTTLTPNSANIIIAPQKLTTSNNQTLIKTKKIDTTTSVAALNESLDSFSETTKTEGNNPLSLFVTTVCGMIILAASILIIKIYRNRPTD